MPPRGMVTALMAALLLSLPLTACSSGRPSAQTLTDQAVRAFHDAPVRAIQGSFQDGVIPVSVAVTDDSHGDASGTGTFDHLPVSFLRIAGREYVQGAAYWHWERLSDWPSWPQLGQQWVRGGADPAASAFQAATRAAGTLDTLNQHADAMSVDSPVRLAGRWVYALTYGATTFDISAGRDHRLVSVHDDTARAGVNLLSRIRLRISYGGTLKAAAPARGQYVDAGDPASLPARYVDMGEVQPAQCGTSGCTLSEKIRNDGGAPVGESVLVITYYQYSGHEGPLGSCQAAIPAIPHNGSAQIGCTATDADLTAWTSRNGYAWDATITNPPYDS